MVIFIEMSYLIRKVLYCGILEYQRIFNFLKALNMFDFRTKLWKDIENPVNYYLLKFIIKLYYLFIIFNKLSIFRQSQIFNYKKKHYTV